METTIAYQCPNCGAGLAFDAHPGYVGRVGTIDGRNGTCFGTQTAAGADDRIGDGFGFEKYGGLTV